MRREFYDAYQRLYDFYDIARPFGSEIEIPRSEFRRESGFRRLAVQNAVERGIAKSPAVGRLRPDALFFLLVNFDQMVARPLALVREGGRDIATDAELAGLVENDVQTILREAAVIPSASASGAEADRGVPARTDEITGGHVVAALATVYGRLETVVLNVWG